MARKKEKEKDGHDRTEAEPPAHRDIKFPRRQASGGYVQPDLPRRHIPTPF